MIKFENAEVYGFHHAIPSIRYSWDSLDKSDSGWFDTDDGENNYNEIYVIGKEDLKLALNTSKAGGSHAKYLRMINVWVDITASLKWWKQMDQYKISTTTNSESTMHTIMRNLLDIQNFRWQKNTPFRKLILEHLNELINKFKQLKEEKRFDEAKEIEDELTDDLPSAFLQKRKWHGNYQVLKAAYHDRENHKLKDWEIFRKFVESLPHSELITLKT